MPDAGPDTTPPNLMLTVQSVARPVLRDATLAVVLSSSPSEQLFNVTLTLVGNTSGGTPVPFTPVAASNCTSRGLTVSPNDLCFAVDFSRPLMNTFTEQFTILARATDVAANQGSASLAIDVTRMRWQTQLANVGTVIASPALDSRGVLWVGSSLSDTTGTLTALSPVGGVIGTITTGSVMSVAISQSGSREFVYAAMNVTGPAGDLRHFSVDGGLTTVSGSGCTAAMPTWSSIALYDGGAGNGSEIRAAIVFSKDMTAMSAQGELCEYSPMSGAVKKWADTNFAQFRPGLPSNSTPYANNIVINGTRALFQSSSGGAQMIGWGDLGGAQGSGTAGASGLFSGAFGTGLAINGTALISTAAQVGLAQIPVSTWNVANPTSPTYASGTLASWSADAWPAASLSQDIVLGNSRLLGGNWVLSAPVSTGTFPPSVLSPTGVTAPQVVVDAQLTTPVVGQSSTNTWVHLVSAGGMLRVYTASPTTGIANGSEVWSADVITSGTVVGHPTLDCNRAVTGGPGTLYVVSSTGQVSAIIVEARRLDPASPWPKWQRTAGNAGNPAFALNPGCP